MNANAKPVTGQVGAATGALAIGRVDFDRTVSDFHGDGRFVPPMIVNDVNGYYTADGGGVVSVRILIGNGRIDETLDFAAALARKAGMSYVRFNVATFSEDGILDKVLMAIVYDDGTKAWLDSDSWSEKVHDYVNTKIGG